MAIRSENNGKGPSSAGLLTDAGNELTINAEEDVGGLRESVEVGKLLKETDGDCFVHFKKDFQGRLSDTKSLRNALFRPSEDFEKKGVEAIDEFAIDCDPTKPENDCLFARLLYDAYSQCAPDVELPEDVCEYYSSDNGRPIG